MLLLLAIALGWLGVAVLFALLCRAAARGEETSIQSPEEEGSLLLDELLIGEALLQPALLDTRRGRSLGLPASLSR